VAGLLIGWLYFQFGGAAAQGNNLVIDEVNRNRSRIPLRMAPLVLLGTVVTHLFGGSAGREGTAIQMGASLADGVRRVLRLNQEDRRLSLMAGISGGFGSVFGVPVAGAVFGMEVQGVGRIYYEGLIPCLVASYVGDLVTRAWGVPHAHYPQFANVPIQPGLLLMVMIAGTAFGLASLVFVELTHAIKRMMALTTKWTPLYPLVGGVTIIAMTWLVGSQDYLGLSLPLIENSFNGQGVLMFAFLLKLIFTAVTLGTGYLGGEVTPLFVIGATLGYSLGGILGVDPTFLAAIGLVAVFAGASNTPLACALMGVELFGGGLTIYLFLGCIVAYLASGHRGIYATQLVHIPKVHGVTVQKGENLQMLAARRGQGWLPRLARVHGPLLQRQVKSLMTAPVVSVDEGASLPQLVTVALAAGVRSVPVVDAQQRVVGIVTDRDLQRSGLNISLTLLRQMTAQERDALMAMVAQCNVRDMMTSPVHTLLATATGEEAVALFLRHHLKRLPIVEAQGRLVGKLTRSDLLRELAFADLPLPADHSVATLQDIDLQPAVTVTTTTPLIDALATMRAAAQTRAIVLNATQQVVGLLANTDLPTRIPAEERPTLLAALVGETTTHLKPLSQTVADVMTTPVVSLPPETTALEALHLLLEQRIKRVPVVDAEGRLLGLVGRAGLLRTLFAPTATGEAPAAASQPVATNE
jgi:H+/Cl- antiporter ClcA/CBS domain-containing protein